MDIQEMRKILLFLAALSISTPTWAQDLTRDEMVVLTTSQTQRGACLSFVQTILSFDLSIKNCRQFKGNVEGLKTREPSPRVEAIKMIYSVAIDTEVVKLHLLRNEPDLAGCEVAKSAMRRFAEFPDGIEDFEGLQALGIESTERLYRYVKRSCSQKTLREIYAIDFGTLLPKIDAVMTKPCTQASGTAVEQMLACLQTIEEIHAITDAHGELLPADANAFSMVNLTVFNFSFEKAQEAGLTDKVVCPALGDAKGLLETFVTPISFSVQTARDDMRKKFARFDAICAAANTP